MSCRSDARLVSRAMRCTSSACTGITHRHILAPPCLEPVGDLDKGLLEAHLGVGGVAEAVVERADDLLSGLQVLLQPRLALLQLLHLCLPLLREPAQLRIGGLGVAELLPQALVEVLDVPVGRCQLRNLGLQLRRT